MRCILSADPHRLQIFRSFHLQIYTSTPSPYLQNPTIFRSADPSISRCEHIHTHLLHICRIPPSSDLQILPSPDVHIHTFSISADPTISRCTHPHHLHICRSPSSPGRSSPQEIEAGCLYPHCRPSPSSVQQIPPPPSEPQPPPPLRTQASRLLPYGSPRHLHQHGSPCLADPPPLPALRQPPPPPSAWQPLPLRSSSPPRLNGSPRHLHQHGSPCLSDPPPPPAQRQPVPFSWKAAVAAPRCPDARSGPHATSLSRGDAVSGRLRLPRQQHSQGPGREPQRPHHRRPARCPGWRSRGQA